MTKDAALVNEALAKPEAFAHIIRHYKNIVFGVALSRIGNFHDAEDVAQNVFIEAFERLEILKDPNRLGAWLRSITIHRSINHVQRKPPVVNMEHMDDLMGKNTTPHGELEQKDLRNQVMSAISRLSKKQQETVTLFYISGYSQQEIADIQEVPLGTIKRRLHDARNKLKTEMLKVVEDTLKKNAPDESFTDDVFKMLYRYPAHNISPEWPTFVSTLENLESHGKNVLEGIHRALASPHWPTRAYTVKVLRNITSLADEDIEPLLKKAVQDSNRHVRRHAAFALLQRTRNDMPKSKKIMPLITPLLQDPSNHLRRLMARKLRALHWASQIPLEVASEALIKAPNPKTREQMELLLRNVLACHKTNAS